MSCTVSRAFFSAGVEQFDVEGEHFGVADLPVTRDLEHPGQGGVDAGLAEGDFHFAQVHAPRWVTVASRPSSAGAWAGATRTTWLASQKAGLETEVAGRQLLGLGVGCGHHLAGRTAELGIGDAGRLAAQGQLGRHLALTRIERRQLHLGEPGLGAFDAAQQLEVGIGHQHGSIGRL